MSPPSTQHVDALWTALAEEMASIEAITFHEASSGFPSAWAIAFEGSDILLVDALCEPDRLVFSMSLGDVSPDQRLEMYETVLRVNAWLAMQTEAVGGVVLSGQQIMLKGHLRVAGLDLDALRQTVLDIQGAAHAWRYFLQTRHMPEENVVLDQWLERV
ncbi:type III secretion system chaperone [uncultured Hydrogenophaga sp.]|uniref:type III secretion system chaperone n=1 Tax=uncultured Hydrogenophaga sp. TaxID=199683 RepID=UPI00265EF631|nr:type III secretion system chaperone [uncultured Hydrogenophaga sp.]